MQISARYAIIPAKEGESVDILQEYSADNIYVRHAVDKAPADDDFSMHVHEQYEIYYFISGNAEYLVEGSRYPLYSGCILIMRPSESHRVKILGSSKYERYAVNFSPQLVKSIDPLGRLLRAFNDRPLGRGNLYYPAGAAGENIGNMFLEIFEVSDDYEKALRITALLFLLLDMLNKEFLNRTDLAYPPPKSAAEKIMSYINAHLFDKLTVPELARRFFLSTSQFGRIFRQASGTSPWEYITIKRLTAAREKIRSGMTAQNAGMSCGFSDYSSFFRAYVKYFGSSPKEDKER